MTTKALVGPLPSVRFRDGTKVAYSAPLNTVDGNRWRNCTDHRVACDCREAEMAEQIAELRGELEYARKAAMRILEGHATYAYEDGPNGQREIGCMCTGCQIVRDAYLVRHSDADSSARDEVDGLNFEQIECGYRWQICIPQMQEKHRGIPNEGAVGFCRAVVSRSRGHYHEHLFQRDEPIVRREHEIVEVPF